MKILTPNINFKGIKDEINTTRDVVNTSRDLKDWIKNDTISIKYEEYLNSSSFIAVLFIIVCLMTFLFSLIRPNSLLGETVSTGEIKVFQIIALIFLGAFIIAIVLSVIFSKKCRNFDNKAIKSKRLCEDILSDLKKKYPELWFEYNYCTHVFDVRLLCHNFHEVQSLINYQDTGAKVKLNGFSKQNSELYFDVYKNGFFIETLQFDCSYDQFVEVTKDESCIDLKYLYYGIKTNEEAI